MSEVSDQQRQRRTRVVRYEATAECSVDGCLMRPRARGWCAKHYLRWQKYGDPLGVAPAGPDVRERFEAKVDRSGNCHRWTGAHNPNGYGHLSIDGRIRDAHVVALLLEGVEIPEGMTVDHVWARGCEYRDCVRVDHLEVVTPRENTLRGNSISAINARKTHCKRGHELTGDNVIRVSQGRCCRTCAQMHEAARPKRSAKASA